jgi:hypothetical protein
MRTTILAYVIALAGLVIVAASALGTSQAQPVECHEVVRRVCSKPVPSVCHVEEVQECFPAPVAALAPAAAPPKRSDSTVVSIIRNMKREERVDPPGWKKQGIVCGYAPLGSGSALICNPN